MATRVSASRLIGRAGELAELTTAFDEAAGGAASLAFLAGESGVGKSRLLHTFLDRARERGGCAIGGECVELGRDELPYAPLVAALRGLLRERDPVLDALSPATREGLAQLVPELDPAAAGSPDEDWRRPFEALLALLEALAEDTPMVLWLDDAQWADHATRAFLAFLGASLPDECRLLTVIAYRSDRLHRRHPMRPLLTELGRGRRARRLVLAPFDRGEVATQLSDILGAAPDQEVVERFFERGEGNPLYTEELLAAGADGRGRLPSTLRDALLLRIERLSETSRGLLRILAVAGRLKHDHFVAVCKIDEDALAGGLREAVEAQVIHVGRDDRYVFRHALLREVIYDDLLPGERAELHLRLARVLEETMGEDDHLAIRAAAVAHHFNAAGDQPQALRTAVAAARAVERGGTPGAAAVLYDRALALWPRVAEPESLAGVEHATLLSLAARAHGLDADEPHAIHLYEQALGEVDEATEPHRVADLLAEIASARWALGQAATAREDLERALGLLPESEPTPERARILEAKARFLLLQGRFAESRDAADEALRAAEAAGVEDTEALVLNRLGLCLFFLGEEERGDRVMRESLELARRSGSNDQLATAFVNYADALHLAGRGEEAAELAAQGEREIAPGDRSALWIACTRSEILFHLGRWEEAGAVLPTRNRGQGTATLANLLLRRASLLLGRGDAEGARGAIEQARTFLADSVEPQYIAPAGALAAELELRVGNVEAAREAAEKAIDQIEYCSDDAARMALISAAAAAVEAAAAERARDLGDAAGLEAAGLRAELMAARTQAAAEAIGGRTLECAYALTAEAHLAQARGDADAAARAGAAAAAWEALARPYQAAQMRLREAEAHAAAADREAAGAAAGRALATAEALGSEWLAGEVAGLIARARLPRGAAGDADGGGAGDGAGRDDRSGAGGAAADEDPFGLTPRERQVLAALAAGATNREIAAELFMAEKTASVHVSRILAKLGVRSRTEAAAVASRRSRRRAADRSRRSAPGGARPSPSTAPRPGRRPRP
ncbi:MAG TPA: AAA family ATPase, partial [Solirubrobacterales bacterium]|nr:AAA family ATPase [Solirubrobacterales bacterium]